MKINSKQLRQIIRETALRMEGTFETATGLDDLTSISLTDAQAEAFGRFVESMKMFSMGPSVTSAVPQSREEYIADGRMYSKTMPDLLADFMEFAKTNSI